VVAVVVLLKRGVPVWARALMEGVDTFRHDSLHTVMADILVVVVVAVTEILIMYSKAMGVLVVGVTRGTELVAILLSGRGNPVLPLRVVGVVVV